MGQPAAKKGDRVSASDMHMIQPPAPASPALVPHPFNGVIEGGVSADVKVEGQPAAVTGSTARNDPPHTPQGGTFVRPPTNQATILKGSTTVAINGKPAARHGDSALTCNDPSDLPAGQVVSTTGTVRIG